MKGRRSVRTEILEAFSHGILRGTSVFGPCCFYRGLREVGCLFWLGESNHVVFKIRVYIRWLAMRTPVAYRLRTVGLGLSLELASAEIGRGGDGCGSRLPETPYPEGPDIVPSSKTQRRLH